MAIFLGVMRSPGGAKRVWVALLSLLAALRALASRNGSRCADLAFFYNEVSLYRGRQLMRGKRRHRMDLESHSLTSTRSALLLFPPAVISSSTRRRPLLLLLLLPPHLVPSPV